MQGTTKHGIHFWNPTHPKNTPVIMMDVRGHGIVKCENLEDAANYLWVHGREQCASEIKQLNG